MFWSSLFVVSVTQGLFVLTLLVIRNTTNKTATRLFMLLILVMVITNFDYLLTATPLYRSIPRFFGISFGLRFLIGPAIYLYTLAVTDADFQWKNRYLLHFTPYLINLLLNTPLFLMDNETKLFYISIFLAGSLRFRTVDIVMIALQNVHLFIYMLLSLKWLKQLRLSAGNSPYIVEMKNRISWLRSLIISFSLLLVFIVTIVLIISIHNRYIPEANRLYTIFTTAIIYFLAYKLILDPRLISPDFARKYQAVKMLGVDNEDELINRLKILMEERKIFTDSDLKLAGLAGELHLTPHQLSRFINEKISKSFNDFVNGYRVNEFINRINDPDYSSYSVYGIAMDVGFNSKSSFNSIFKKFTGKTPSEFKAP
jgi:AraC-like DNA-binding protein